jgi:ligand-binding SRPBCC domain-containing protein
VDERCSGPYRVWIHEHTFAECEGGTLVDDHVRYAIPGGWLADRLFVGCSVAQIFAYRQKKLSEFFA